MMVEIPEIQPIRSNAMNELKNKYTAMRQQAVEMMQNGNVNAYLAKLVDLNDLRLQLINLQGQHG
jgi:hypothetical protein